MLSNHPYLILNWFAKYIDALSAHTNWKRCVGSSCEFIFQPVCPVYLFNNHWLLAEHIKEIRQVLS